MKQFLRKQDAYTLHKKVIYKFPRNRIYVSKIDEIWQIDLVQLDQYKKDNDGYSYLLTAICSLSRYAWAVPLKNKTGRAVTEAFRSILDNSGRQPLKIYSDLGVEFFNREFKSLLNARGIGHYHIF